MADVLAVFAHPDDEVLGCGGTLAKHAEAGDRFSVVCYAREDLVDSLAEAVKVLGGGFFHLMLPDQKLDTLPFKELAAGPFPFIPDVIYTHHPGDLNLDHALVARAVLTAFRPKPDTKPCRIMTCEIASSTEYTYPRVFQPNWYEGLSGEQVSKASEALRCYESELQIWPHPRSQLGIVHRAKVRGSEVGVEFAEAFQLLRAGPF